MNKKRILGLVLAFVLGLATANFTTATVEAAKLDRAMIQQVTLGKTYSNDGGWQASKKYTVTKAKKKIFKKATKELVGVQYTPIAYLGSQVVAGTNHLYLCKLKAVLEDVETGYALVYVYQDLDGKAKVSKIKRII